MAGKKTSDTASDAKWYEVVELSYIDDRLVQPGERVQYDPGPDGTVGKNLRELSEEELGK